MPAPEDDAPQTSRARLKKLARAAFPPADYIDERLRGIHDHIDVSVDQHLRPHLDRRVDAVENALRIVQAQLSEVISKMGSDTQSQVEFQTTFRRATDQMTAEVRQLWEVMAGGLEPGFPELLRLSATGAGTVEGIEADIAVAKVLTEWTPGAADRIVGAHEGTELPIGPGLADLLNWANGHLGPAGQAGVWFNPPVTVRHGDGTVVVGHVNERIVEIPFALGAVAGLDPGSHVLDFGAAESTLALSIAGLGHDVVAADLHEYPFTHPRLNARTGPIEEWDGPERPFDAVVCVSALEHVGLGAYDEAVYEGRSDLDVTIARLFARWLRPGGQLVLTAPYGAYEVTETQRIYDRPHLDAVLERFEVTDRVVCVQTGPALWERAGAEPPASTWDDGTRGVVMVRATPR